MTIYKKIKNSMDIEFIVRDNKNGTETHIPMVEENPDYQHYLRWLENPDAEENGTLS